MFKGFLFFLREGWKCDKKYVLWLFAKQLIAATLPIAGALLPKFLLDEVLGRAEVSTLISLVLGFALYILIANALTEFFTWDEFTHRMQVFRKFHLKLYERLVYADYESIDSAEYQQMRQRAEKFLYCNYKGFGYLLTCAVNILGQLLTLVGLIAVLSVLDAGFVLLFAALTVLCSLIENRAAKKALAMHMKAADSERAIFYYSNLFQSAEYAKEIRLSAAQQPLLAHWLTAAKYNNSCYKGANRYHIRSGIARAGFGFVQTCAAYLFMLQKVLNDSMSVGTLTMCVGAVSSFSEALRSLLHSFNEIRAYDLYYDDLDTFLNRPAQLRESGKAPVEAQPHRIELRNVSFRYPGAETWSLKNVSLTLEKGQRLALVGENGSGKSTLVKLFCRLYDPTEGCILLDGRDIRTLDYDSYLAQFSTVLQDFKLFDLPVRENLTLGRDADDATLMELLHRVGLDERIRTLPHGLDTHIGRTFSEEGFEPSGGEAQKLALVRALLRDAPVIVLDEPAAALDARAEYDLYRQFDELVQGRSAVYISHRMSSCRFCDRIAVLDGGELIEEGTHEELLARGGRYAELYTLQAQYYLDQPSCEKPVQIDP